jgi:hypothetical protein
MAGKTKQELARDVLRQLGVLDALHTPAAEDSAYIEDAYDHKLSELRDKGLAYWPNTTRTAEEIPEAVYGALVDIMSDDCAGTFGITPEQVIDYDTNRPCSVGARGMRNLRRHMMKRPSGEPTRAVYF